MDQFNGIVLFKQPYRERDGLVKIFIPSYGTKMFFVRGMSKAEHKLKTQLLPLTYNEYWGTINQVGMSFIDDARTINFHRPLQEDVMKNAYGIYFAQLVDAGLPDGEPQDEMFDLLNISLNALEKLDEHQIIATHVELKMLPHFGYTFDWQHCVVCGKNHGYLDFSAVNQGMLCKNHLDRDAYRLHLSRATSYLVQLLPIISLNQINLIRISETTLKELREFTNFLYQEYVGIRLKSKSYIDQMLEFQEKFKNGL